MPEECTQRPLVRPVGADRQIVLRALAVGSGSFLELPFDVPQGCNRVDVRLESARDAALGLGLFDERGPQYQSPGFRGVYGEERHELTVAADVASPSFLPGPVGAGRWTVLVPVIRVPVPIAVAVVVTLGFGPQPPHTPPASLQGSVRDEPGWYRGDLHCHTSASSDAWATGRALDPPAWAATASAEGLDFLALTDHNVVTQNRYLEEAAADTGVLLLAGEEMTNSHGHATVCGLQPDEWLDFRQRPEPLPLGAHEERITAFFATARELGAYVAAAHPFAGGLGWQFLAEGVRDPAARPDGLEVWNGHFRDEDGCALEGWDRLLRAGLRLTATGGTDLHGVDVDGVVFGSPTTVVHADALSRSGLVDGLRRGRAFLTRRPAGPSCILTVGGADGHTVGMGGVARAPLDRSLPVAVDVCGGAGTAVGLVAGGRSLHTQTVTRDEETIRSQVPTTAGYVRAEVRDTAGGALQALSNPVYLEARRPEEQPADSRV